MLFIAHDAAAVTYKNTWTDTGSFHETSDWDAALAISFWGDTGVQLVVGTGPDHSIFDVYINGSLWDSFDAYAASTGERTIDVEILNDGLQQNTLEVRNRYARNVQSTGYKLRFKHLVVPKVTEIDYAYDGLSRLLTANYNGGAVEYTYGYDVAGNLVNNNGVTRTYNAANQMVNDGTNTLTYDANGNLTNDGMNSLTWDRANRMLTAPGSTSYKYDGVGNRIQQTVSSVVTDYLNDVQPGLVKLLRQDDGSNVDHFVHAVRGIHSVDNGTDWMWYAQDGLGSVRGLVDASADVVNSQSYNPIGVPDTDYGAGFGFTGEQTDANDLLYLRARYYAPDMGVFTALDPFEGIQSRPMSLNGYSWVEGNLPNAVDPSGMMCETLGKACGAVAISPFDAVFGDIPVCGAFFACLGIVVIPLAFTAIANLISPNNEFEQYSTGSSSAGTGNTQPPTDDPRQGILNYAFDTTRGQIRDYIIDNAQDLARGLNDGACLDRLFGGILPSRMIDWLAAIGVIALSTVRPRERDNNDDDCLSGKSKPEAAREYALKARAIYDELASNLGGNPPAVIAVTRAKRSSDSDCKYFVGINNVLSPENNSETRRRHLNRARNGVLTASNTILNQFPPIPAFGSSGPIGTGNGPEGHAEYNLYIGLTPLGASVVAIGISEEPCPYCDRFFSGLEDVVLESEGR